MFSSWRSHVGKEILAPRHKPTTKLSYPKLTPWHADTPSRSDGDYLIGDAIIHPIGPSRSKSRPPSPNQTRPTSGRRLQAAAGSFAFGAGVHERDGHSWPDPSQIPTPRGLPPSPPVSAPLPPRGGSRECALASPHPLTSSDLPGRCLGWTWLSRPGQAWLCPRRRRCGEALRCSWWPSSPWSP
jgi:hypothetical protein